MPCFICTQDPTIENSMQCTVFSLGVIWSRIKAKSLAKNLNDLFSARYKPLQTQVLGHVTQDVRNSVFPHAREVAVLQELNLTTRECLKISWIIKTPSHPHLLQPPHHPWVCLGLHLWDVHSHAHHHTNHVSTSFPLTSSFTSIKRRKSQEKLTAIKWRVFPQDLFRYQRFFAILSGKAKIQLAQ